jgi:hypothetical protein
MQLWCHPGVITCTNCVLRARLFTQAASFFAPPALEKLVAAADDWMAKGPNEKDSMV